MTGAIRPERVTDKFNNLESVISRQMWPTPDACATARYNKSASPNAANRPTLALAVRLWPTPRTTDGSHGGRVTPRKSREGGNLIEAVAFDFKKDNEDLEWIGGQLNPTWVDWLMGAPLGWTDLSPLGMHKFHSAWLLPMRSCLKELLDEKLAV
jgi:hypothetical protein